MKRAAEAEIKDFIRSYRLICERLKDCPIKPARQPSQLDCWTCMKTDIDNIKKKARAFDKIQAEVTDYGTTITKLEAMDDEGTITILKRQMGKGSNGPDKT